MFSFNAVARAISVILGDEWRSLSSEARKVYIMEAKTLAEEHKRIYPDCWKRKRTQVSEQSIGKNAIRISSKQTIGLFRKLFNIFRCPQEATESTS